MRPLVKLCGITNLQDALFCAQAGADFLGFIFYKKSPRYIDPSKAQAIIGRLPQRVKSVGIFVNEERTTIEEIVRTTGVQIIQLSGDEPPGECEHYPVDIWKCFRFRSEDETVIARNYNVSAVMLDGANDDRYGGSGSQPDLSIAVKMKRFHPVIVAGGLNPDNITETVQFVEPFAIDVNSGVEVSPGKKDHVRIRQLFERLSQLSQT